MNAAIGLLDGVDTNFENHLDVSNGGVLFSLPFLLSNGLLHDIDKYFSFAKGYYRLDHIFILIGFMALARIKNPEQLKSISPGEWGKLLGLDRIPETKTVRNKIKAISSSPQLKDWCSSLSRKWLNEDEFSGLLYIDGHVRLYHGKQTNLPKRFVSREKLCLRSMMDYWVNDHIGRPFFVCSTALTRGMTKTLKDEVIPRILEELTACPSDEELKADPKKHKFVMIYDRESYSYKLMDELRKMGIASQTYNKFPGSDWDVNLFQKVEVKSSHGNISRMKIAEIKFEKEFKDEDKKTLKVMIREIRVLTKSGHQTAIISTDYQSDAASIASHMFSRWCQENYFKYMMEHFDIDRLVDYSVQDINDIESVVSPAYRKLEGEVRREAGRLGKLHLDLGKTTAQMNSLDNQITQEKGRDEKTTTQLLEFEKKLKKDQLTISELLTSIKISQDMLDKIKLKRKEEPKRIEIKDLPEDERFKQLMSPAKQFIDTIKMIAYRAETAMDILIKEWLPKNKRKSSRAVLRALYNSDVNILPKSQESILEIQLHTSSSPSLNQTFKHLAQHLNETEFLYPGTELKMFFSILA
jgi:hypothetical protein